jgi:L-fuconolactonase
VRVDAHQHFWNYDPVRDAWIGDNMGVLKRDYSPADLLPEIQRNGIDATIAVQTDQSERETEFLLEQARQNPFVAGVVGWVDLRAANLEQRLEDFSQSKKLRGFRNVAQSEPDDQFLIRDDFVRGVAKLSRFGFTYDILIYARQLPAAVALVERLPDQDFVLDHIGKPDVKAREIEKWSAGIRALAANPRVYCKLSGMITEADWNNWRPADFKPYLDVVFEAFSVDRLMFGSDWPVCLLAGSYAQVKGLIDDYVRDWPKAVCDKLFGGNAARFYGLRTSV